MTVVDDSVSTFTHESFKQCPVGIKSLRAGRLLSSNHTFTPPPVGLDSCLGHPVFRITLFLTTRVLPVVYERTLCS